MKEIDLTDGFVIYPDMLKVSSTYWECAASLVDLSGRRDTGKSEQIRRRMNAAVRFYKDGRPSDSFDLSDFVRDSISNWALRVYKRRLSFSVRSKGNNECLLDFELFVPGDELDGPFEGQVGRVRRILSSRLRKTVPTVSSLVFGIARKRTDSCSWTMSIRIM